MLSFNPLFQGQGLTRQFQVSEALLVEVDHCLSEERGLLLSVFPISSLISAVSLGLTRERSDKRITCLLRKSEARKRLPIKKKQEEKGQPAKVSRRNRNFHLLICRGNTNA